MGIGIKEMIPIFIIVAVIYFGKRFMKMREQAARRDAAARRRKQRG